MTKANPAFCFVLVFSVIFAGEFATARACGGRSCSIAKQKLEIAIALRPSATPLERLAAQELKQAINNLFSLEAAIVTQSPKKCCVLTLGTVDLPGAGDQGILLRPRKNGLLIGGGSPKAVLWAVYELMEWWGVRYLTSGDILPENAGAFRLPKSEIRLEPNMRTRCWRLVNDLANGPISWSLAENKRFLRQIAKMKYNRVVLSFWPCQPFVHYSFRGMVKPPPVIYFGERYPIDDDTVGREKFGDVTHFINPEFVGANSPGEMVEQATRLARGIIAEAKRLGMETGIVIQPFDWPKEFMAVLPGSEPVKQLGNLTAGPGKDQSMDDPLLQEMIATIIRAYIETYPDVDYIYIGMPEHRGWTEQAEKAYNTLDTAYGLDELGTFEQLCRQARGRKSFPGGGERVETMLRGDLASLAFFDSLVHDCPIGKKNLLARPGGAGEVKLVYSGIVAELFPLLAKMACPGGEVLSFIDYTASRQLKQRDLLRQKPPEGLPANLIFTLADDNVGVLPQLATGSLHELMKELRANGWSGFYTRYWTIGELEPAVYYLARASWNPAETPESAYRDLFEHTTGPKSIKPAMEALAIIEQVTKKLDQHGLGFGFPVPNMMTKHYDAGGLSDAIRADHVRYRKALSLMRTAREGSTASGRVFLDYLVGRLAFAVYYLDAAQAFGKAGLSQRDGQPAAAVKYIDDAYTAIRKALKSWADVAADHSDLGAVALLNKYCYRPIRDKRAELKRRTQ